MPRPIHEVSVENFLSLRRARVELRDLNVLVGPNGSGKSNFLRIFDFIGAVASNDLIYAIDQYDGFQQLAFRRKDCRHFKISLKGQMTELASNRALDEYSIRIQKWDTPKHISKKNEIGSIYERKEEIKLKRVAGRGRRITLSGSDLEVVSGLKGRAHKERELEVQQSSSGLALLRRLGDDFSAPQVESIARVFEDLRLIEIDVPAARRPSEKRPVSRLYQNGSNIAAFLHQLHETDPCTLKEIERDVRFVLPSFDSFDFQKIGGADTFIRVAVRETPFDQPIPLSRVSFGTVRSIVLFSMLHDPNPPRLTCVEEIDHGLHPQALDRLVDRLREASSRTQLIIATHSPALVNRLQTEELVMFVRDSETGASNAVQPDPDLVARMRQESGYRLGELWFAGLLEDDYEPA